ncbi:MAG: hypothetical protein H6563_06645 [Lewinellaceae bacterium]|nr:hypothetical protein [Lewinellaceae bacterium]
MKRTIWLILGFLILGAQEGFSQDLGETGKLDGIVQHINQLETSKDQWVDSLTRVAMDTSQSGEIRRAAFLNLGKVRSEKALKFLVDQYNTRIYFAEGEGLGDDYPAVLSIYENQLGDFALIEQVFQSLRSGEKTDMDIALLAMIATSVVENNPNLDKGIVQRLAKNRRKAIGYRNISATEQRNLNRFIGFFY